VSEAALGYISLILADGNCVINAANIDALLQSVGLIGNERSSINVYDLLDLVDLFDPLNSWGKQF
jgi:hypothetical protein